MKPNTKTITGTTKRGRQGIRFEHDISLGSKVRTEDGRVGKVIGPGMAGMPEVGFDDGSSIFAFPSELEIMEESA